jgi:hypothetical protein
VEGLADCMSYLINIMIEKKKKSAGQRQVVQLDMMGALVSVSVLVILHFVLAMRKLMTVPLDSITPLTIPSSPHLHFFSTNRPIFSFVTCM